MSVTNAALDQKPADGSGSLVSEGGVPFPVGMAT